MDKQKLLFLIANDEDVRKAVVRLMRTEQLQTPLITDPGSGVTLLRAIPTGMITYKTAAAMSGVTTSYIRNMVSRAYFPGGDGLVERKPFIEFVLSQCKEKMRAHLIAYLESEDAHTEPAPVQQPPSRQLQQRRAAELMPSLFQAEALCERP